MLQKLFSSSHLRQFFSTSRTNLPCILLFAFSWYLTAFTKHLIALIVSPARLKTRPHKMHCQTICKTSLHSMSIA